LADVGNRILVVEDDESIGSALTRTLEGQGYDVTWTRGGTEGLATAERLSPALVLLDLGLPDADGVDVCRALRVRLPEAAILILTARHDEADVVVGLDAGANDYVTKPFRLAELLARVRSQLRQAAIDPDEVEVGDLVVDLGARRAIVGDVELVLRPREFDLLALLASEAGQALTRERIMREVWDEHWFGSTKTLDVHISSLRRKLAEGAGPNRPTITSLRNVGYRFELP
jgi:DNA-binding response OmpR family regulator